MYMCTYIYISACVCMYLYSYTMYQIKKYIKCDHTPTPPPHKLFEVSSSTLKPFVVLIPDPSAFLVPHMKNSQQTSLAPSLSKSHF